MKIFDLLMRRFFPLIYCFFYGKVLSKALRSEKVFWGDKAVSIKTKLLHYFVLTGRTIPHAEVNLEDNSFYKSSNKDIVSELKNKGYFVVDSYIPKDVCERIIEYAENTPSFPRPLDEQTSSLPIRTKINFNEPYLSARYDFSPDVLSILQNQDLQNLMSDPFLIGIAEEYLSCLPYLDPIELWWFLPYPIRDAGWAEDYHFDFDSVRWLKFFFNFEDIELENGPHSFIEGTHKDFGIPEDLRKRGYVRHSDEDVFRYIDRSNEKKFTLKAGSLLIEDTRGLHKGTSPVAGRRLMFQFQLSNYLFLDQANINNKFKPEFAMSDEFFNLWKKRPEFFSRYFE